MITSEWKFRAVRGVVRAIILLLTVSVILSGATVRADAFSEEDWEIAEYTKEIRETPEVFTCYVNRARIYMKYDRFEEAMTDISKAIEMRPDFRGSYGYRAYIYEKMGRYDLAVRDYERLLDGAKGAIVNTYWRYLELAYDAVGDSASAKALRDAYEGESLSAVDYYSIAGAFAEDHRKQYDEAIKYYATAIDMDPNDSRFFSGRGSAYKELRMYDLAIEDYKKAIGLDTKKHDVKNLHYRALLDLYRKIGNDDIARAGIEWMIDDKTGNKARYGVTELAGSPSGWAGGKYPVPDLGIALNASDGLIASGKDEIVLMNARASEGDPKTLAMIEDPSVGIHFSLSVWDYGDSADFNAIAWAYRDTMLDLLGGDPESANAEEIEFCGIPAVMAYFYAGDDVVVHYFVRFDARGYVATCRAPIESIENDEYEAFWQRLIAYEWDDPDQFGYFGAAQGSAKLLEGRNLIVSVQVTYENAGWSAAESDRARRATDVAAKWIINEGKKYGKQIEFIYDTEAHPDLLYHMRYDISEYGNMLTPRDPSVNEFSLAFRKSVENTYHAFHDYIEANVPFMELCEKYETDSISYIMYFTRPGGYVACALPVTYWYKDIDEYSYHEAAALYLDDDHLPAVVAHEILHLFGASDLYDPDNYLYDGVDLTLHEYVKATYPNDIMLSAYSTGNDGIFSEISPLTAYGIGWLNDIPELERFPAFKRYIPALNDRN